VFEGETPSLTGETPAPLLLSPLPLTGRGLQLVTECAVVTAFETASPALALAGFHQVLQAAGSLDRRLTALSATLVALHSQLVLPLPGQGQGREFVLYRCSHFNL